MRHLITTILVAAVCLGSGTYAYKRQAEISRKLEFSLEKEKLRAGFLEKSSSLWGMNDASQYRQELLTRFKNYSAALMAVNNRFPEFERGSDRVLKEMEAAVATGKMSKADLESRREWYDATKETFDALASGKYAPIQSFANSGLRFDVVKVGRVTYEGKSRLKIDLAVWGAPRHQDVEKVATGTGSVKNVLDLAIRSLSLEFVDANKKLLGGGDASTPGLMVEYPERWVPDFPPQVALATYWIDPLPRESTTMSVKLGFEIRTDSQGAVESEIQWQQPVPEEWKLREGEKFEGEERLMGADEMDRSKE